MGATGRNVYCQPFSFYDVPADCGTRRLLHPYWIVHNRLCSECECFLGWSGEQRIIVSRSALMPLLVHSRVRNLYFYDGCANMGHRIGASSMARSSRWLVQLVRHRSRLNTVALQYPHRCFFIGSIPATGAMVGTQKMNSTWAWRLPLILQIFPPVRSSLSFYSGSNGTSRLSLCVAVGSVLKVRGGTFRKVVWTKRGKSLLAITAMMERQIQLSRCG